MNIYNVTKYHPETRGEIDEWTEISDINRTFDGVVFTLEEYLRVESNYVKAIERIMDYLGVKTLTVSYLERRDYDYRPSSKRAFNTLYPIRMRDLRKKVKPGKVLSRDQIPNMLRLMFRNTLYAELEYKVNESDEQYSFKVFFGYDYMMGVHSLNDLSPLRDELLHLDMYLED
ncbi:hypothetical protein A6395_00575 [Exiguobacterium sp. SH31]|uniref:hypothetical protein n=1 Tax=unclassified Exiguobacterium TaxID=2644629 RepID=UPI0008D66D7E|nr:MULTISPECIES: hypothetical protein [unclassified Exiguobacterium]OGX80668.1 hypothetical protein A6395_00575 [Exiguobacterium sp. SH31]TCI69822.1 hypothetical protein EVJ22_09790 [Exiguobacterium sp. SH0S7]